VLVIYLFYVYALQAFVHMHPKESS